MELRTAALNLLKGFGDGDGFFETAVPGLTLMQSSEVTLPRHVLYRPSLCLIIQGAKEMSVGETGMAYREGQFLIVTLDVPVLGRVVEASPQRPYVGLSLELDMGVVCDVVDHMSEPPDAGGDRGFGLFVEEAGQQVADCLLRLIRLAEQADGLRILHSSIMREIAYWLLAGPNGGRVARLALGTAPAQRIAGAIRFIRESFASPITIEQLADLSNMSPSSFHQHFKALTSMTPLQFQKQLRLIEAKRLMTTDAVGVAEAAFKVGYESASQFSREYSRMFGTPPARDGLLFRRRVGRAARDAAGVQHGRSDPGRDTAGRPAIAHRS